MSTIIALLISALALTSSAEKACLPVFIIHGILEPAIRLTPLKNTIEKSPDCPNGRNVTLIKTEQLMASFTPLWGQVEAFRNFLLPHFQRNPDGIHLIGYSQGSIIARAVVETTDNHTVRTLVTIAGIHTGVSGFPVIDTDFLGLHGLFDYLGLSDVVGLWSFCYKKSGQALFAGCNYWRDEHHFDDYIKHNVFLPYINNDINHTKSEQYKRNLITLNKFVMIATKDDEFVFPWQSGLFGWRNANETVIDMEDQEIYKNDTLGLKTLNEQGKLIRFNTSGVDHLAIPNNYHVITEFIIPYLD